MSRVRLLSCAAACSLYAAGGCFERPCAFSHRAVAAVQTVYDFLYIVAMAVQKAQFFLYRIVMAAQRAQFFLYRIVMAVQKA